MKHRDDRESDSRRMSSEHANGIKETGGESTPRQTRAPTLSDSIGIMGNRKAWALLAIVGSILWMIESGSLVRVLFGDVDSNAAMAFMRSTAHKIQIVCQCILAVVVCAMFADFFIRSDRLLRSRNSHRDSGSNHELMEARDRIRTLEGALSANTRKSILPYEILEIGEAKVLEANLSATARAYDFVKWARFVTIAGVILVAAGLFIGMTHGIGPLAISTCVSGAYIQLVALYMLRLYGMAIRDAQQYLSEAKYYRLLMCHCAPGLSMDTSKEIVEQSSTKLLETFIDHARITLEAQNARLGSGPNPSFAAKLAAKYGKGRVDADIKAESAREK